MDSRVIALLVICIAAVSVAGCTTQPAEPAAPATLTAVTHGKTPLPPVSSAFITPADLSAMTIRASPRQYSPVMSSTPGIGLEPVVSGFSAENAKFTWMTTHGQFLSWNSPDFRVSQLGDTAASHGEKIYWSFSDPPASTQTPVIITVTATDAGSGRILGSSTIFLDWQDNYSVTVRERA